MANLWKHGSDPSGQGLTVARLSSISVPVADGHVCHFSPNVPAIGFKDVFTGPSPYGLFTTAANTNLVTSSEQLAGWATANAAVSDGFSNSPDGFRSAARITASADNGYVAEVITTVAATQYTLSVWVKESTAGATGRVILHDETGSVEVASQAFATTGTWQRGANNRHDKRRTNI